MNPCCSMPTSTSTAVTVAGTEHSRSALAISARPNVYADVYSNIYTHVAHFYTQVDTYICAQIFTYADTHV